jgi:hypothetical protein
LGAFIQRHLFSPPFFRSSPEFWSDSVRVDELLSETLLQEHQGKRNRGPTPDQIHGQAPGCNDYFPFALSPSSTRRRIQSFDLSPGPALLSWLDRLSPWDRRSPVNRFSSSDRVSVPDRLSLVTRLSVPDRFSSSPMVVSPLVAENHAGWNRDYRGSLASESARKGIVF